MSLRHDWLIKNLLQSRDHQVLLERKVKLALMTQPWEIVAY